MNNNSVAALIRNTQADSATYQTRLVSGVSIKTVNGKTILGSGNIVTAETYDVMFSQVGNITYIGRAAVGSATSSPVWEIKKATDTTVTFADNVTTFTKIWDNRLSYTY